MKRTNFCKEHSAGLEVIQIPNKTIIFPFAEETYPELLEDKPAYKAHVHAWIEAHPELFPETIREGWSLNGLTRESAKQGIRMRRITQLNGFTYHECWLQNMLVATSGQAIYRFRRNKVG